MKKIVLSGALILWCCLYVGANVWSADTLKTERKNSFFIKAGFGYAAGMTVLGTMWYRDKGLESFRFFNDWPEWKQMDKAGHLYTGYHLTRAVYNGCNKSRSRNNGCLFKSALFSIITLSSIEVFDGFSPAYGASVTDVATNIAGSIVFAAQEMHWGKQLFIPRFSFHADPIAEKRPEVLGSMPLERVLKNYNGQTYWLSADLDKFSNSPGWLNIAVGYGANEMLFGRDLQNFEAGFSARRRLFIGLDIDLKDIPVKKPWLKKLFSAMNLIRIPAPAFEFHSKGIRIHPLYF